MNFHFRGIYLIEVVLLLVVNKAFPQQTAENYNQFSINQFNVLLSNSSFIEPFYNDTTSLQIDAVRWPGGVNAYQTALFDQTIFWGGYSDTTFMYVPLFNDMVPGKILDTGLPDNPNNPRYRIFRIRKGWETSPYGAERNRLEKDYNEWPADDGAPWLDLDKDGIFTRGVDQPDYNGDEVLYFVSNDMDTLHPVYMTNPIGLEIHCLLYGFNRAGIMGDLIIEKVTFINKSIHNIKNFYVGEMPYVFAGDYMGYDTAQTMLYSYFKTNQSIVYGDNPPTFGNILLQGPVQNTNLNDSAYFNNKWRKGFKNLRPSSAICFVGPHSNNAIQPVFPYPNREPPYNEEIGNTLLGKLWSGHTIYNPVTNQPTTFMLTGDPVAQTGWYMGGGWPYSDSLYTPIPGEDYSNSASIQVGPFTLAPFDTQEVVYGILAARGADNLNSVTELKRRAAIIKKAYYLNFQLTPLPVSPPSFAFEQQGEITLWWKPDAESYDEGDPFIYDQGYEDTTYTFEGYRVWQYRDSLGTDPRLLAVYDRTDGITVIEDYTIANGVSVKLPIIIGNDEGLRRQTTITTDAYTHRSLNNGSPYYFGVTSYGYSKNSSPAFLESKPKVVEVIPGRDKIDYSSPYIRGDEVLAEQVNGLSNADVIFRVVDPTRITGDSYKVSFYGDYDSLKYMLINTTVGDTLFKGENDYSADTLHRKVFDGFMVIVNNKGHKQIDSLPPSFQPYGISRIVQTRGPGGIPLDNPVDVYNSLNSTGRWKITSTGGIIQNIDVFNYIFI